MTRYQHSCPEGCRVSEAARALLDATLLHDELVVGDAISALENHLVVSAGSLDETIYELFSVPNCLEYTLSGKSLIFAFTSRNLHHSTDNLRNLCSDQ